MIEMRAISKRYGDVKALDDINFKINKGQIVGFLGANGAGKTTAMDIICGCIGADSGEVLIDGKEVSEHPLQIKQKLGYMPDTPPLHNEMRVAEYIKYVAVLRGLSKHEQNRSVAKILSKLSLTSVSHRLIGNLSKGYRQRVGLAQSLIHDPEVLILDEPTEGLDPNQIVQIRELIKSLHGEHTILFSSHILSEVASICENLIIINKGKIVKTGNYTEILQHAEATKSFELKVHTQPEKLIDELNKLQEIQNPILQKDQTITFQSQNESLILDDIAEAVLKGGYGLRGLSPKTKSLEDVFFQLTK